MPIAVVNTGQSPIIPSSVNPIGSVFPGGSARSRDYGAVAGAVIRLDRRDAEIVALAFCGGLRRSEIAALV